MGLFKSQEDKNNQRQQKINKYLATNKLDDLDEEDKELIGNITSDATIDAVMQVGAYFKSNSIEYTNMQQNDMLIKQNWMIIRKLDQICKKLDK